MGRMGSFDLEGLREFRDQLNRLQDADAFVESCARELAARLLRLVIRRTPVDTGELRRRWTGGSMASATAYADSLTIRHVGNDYVVEIINPTEYASYVEYGHRTRGGDGWVNGRFMMTISENELRSMAPRILENKIRRYLGGVFGD